MLVGFEGGAPPAPPPAPAQLVRPKELRMRSKSKNVPRCRRRIATGIRMRPRPTKKLPDANGFGEWPVFCADVDEMPVAIFTVTLPVALAFTVSFGGLKVQEEFAGSEPQLKLKVPLEPPIVARLRAKLAD